MEGYNVLVLTEKTFVSFISNVAPKAVRIPTQDNVLQMKVAFF